MFLVMRSDSNSARRDLFSDNNRPAIHYLVINDQLPTMASYHSLCRRLFLPWEDFSALFP